MHYTTENKLRTDEYFNLTNGQLTKSTCKEMFDKLKC